MSSELVKCLEGASLPRKLKPLLLVTCYLLPRNSEEPGGNRRSTRTYAISRTFSIHREMPVSTLEMRVLCMEGVLSAPKVLPVCLRRCVVFKLHGILPGRVETPWGLLNWGKIAV